MPRKFLVVVDDSPEFEGALRYAARRARSTGGHVVMLRVIPPAASDAHWAGVREEIERQTRAEAESTLNGWAAEAAERSGSTPILLIERGDAQGCIRKVVGEDPDIKILVLAAGSNAPGPLVAAVVKQGAAFTGRKLPVTIVPGELTEKEIEDLA
ncbi:nucleotide-binding universal stress UspA family protein [Brevundimonas alba]|uniref:Nucleotide-binding universal stress UspA family protein n=1 Tax=Brevundimonas alba TaxID=74314 RepID=A0A7X5YIR9_9CAUL|nr:universal stress protein [Brevundimonas alba]NJC40713.1 nucleotide-binding universal stress UspA family protein [Brevundimonas alba]